MAHAYTPCLDSKEGVFLAFTTVFPRAARAPHAYTPCLDSKEGVFLAFTTVHHGFTTVHHGFTTVFREALPAAPASA